MEGLPDQETESILCRLNQKHIKKDRDGSKFKMDSNDFNFELAHID